MKSCFLNRPRILRLIPAAGLLLSPLLGGSATAQVTLNQLSQDSYTNTSSQHATEVEPGSFSHGNTIVSAFQVARISGGGGADIGFAISTDAGKTWQNGYLPGITIFQGGLNQAASDAAVAYDAAHGEWLISTLPIGSASTTVAVSRSADGITWSKPITVTHLGSPDKNWITCDSTPTSKFYGHCYTEWDDTNNGNQIEMSTSTDGGKTWGPALSTLRRDSGIGGQPLVQPNGTVVVPIMDLNGDMVSFSSIDGGKTWAPTVLISVVQSHFEDGNLRSAGLPSAAADAVGTIYVVWPDCRFRKACASNDLVLSTSTDGKTWSKVTRVPIDVVTSTVDHFITGLGIDPATSGATAHLGLTYYYYPVSNCTQTSCKLEAGFIQSATGGKTWFGKQHLAGPMSLNWLPNTFSGNMVADYITVSYAAGEAFPIFAVAHALTGSLFHQAIYTTAAGFSAAKPANEVELSSANDRPVPGVKSDHGPMQYYDLDHERPIPGRGGRPPLEKD
jgi:hypothetical protein